jgi:hypothetical protein
MMHKWPCLDHGRILPPFLRVRDETKGTSYIFLQYRWRSSTKDGVFGLKNSFIDARLFIKQIIIDKN